MNPSMASTLCDFFGKLLVYSFVSLLVHRLIAVLKAHGNILFYSGLFMCIC